MSAGRAARPRKSQPQAAEQCVGREAGQGLLGELPPAAEGSRPERAGPAPPLEPLGSQRHVKCLVTLIPWKLTVWLTGVREAGLLLYYIHV